MQSDVNPFWKTQVGHVVEAVFMCCPNFKQKFKCVKNNVQGRVLNALVNLPFKIKKRATLDNDHLAFKGKCDLLEL